MKAYLISNNLLLNSLKYDNDVNLELVRMVRPLNSKGEDIAKKISDLALLHGVERIYSSFHSSALATAKNLAEKLELDIILDDSLNDCRVGILGSKNMKMVKGMQDHDFNYKLASGESLRDVGNRLNNFLIHLNNKDSAIFTHKRTILGLILKYSKAGYNLDENLIVDYNGKIIYDDSETYFDIYELEIKNNEIVDIKRI